VISEILNSDCPRTWSWKICAVRDMAVAGRAMSDMPVDRAVFPSGDRTCNGCVVSSMSSCAATASLWRRRVKPESESAIAEGCCVVVFKFGAGSVGARVEDRMF
jgi:hypothetical protein